jgi:hypothetical protein
MRDYVLVPALGAVMAAPSLVSLVVAVILRHSRSGKAVAYGIGAFLWLVFVAVGIGLNMYTYSIHPMWWSKEYSYIMPIGEVIASIGAVSLGWYATTLLLPDLNK